ncbi:MAG TPA: SPOR domain-containing protein [Pelomicrobium sp.]|nr:SPOR domain-containing protein [Pelomicrobium sp.]
MVLDREPQPVTQPLDVRIPAKEQAPALPEPPPAMEPPGASGPAKPAGKTTEKTPEKPAEKAPEKAPEKAAAAPVKPPGSEPKPVPEPAKPSKPASATQEAFVVQLGAFSSADNARQLKDKLAGGGIKAYTETVTTAQGKQTRVRAGPYPTREAAEKTLARVKQLGLDGIVTTQ